MPQAVALPPATLVAGAALLLAVILLWLRPWWLWLAGFGVACIAGYVAGVMEGPAGFALFALAGLVERHRWAAGPVRFAYGVGIAVVALVLALHLAPGFHNPVVLRDAVLSAGARPYSLYVNFDKGLAGLLMLGAGSFARLRTAADWRAALAGTWPIALATIAVVLVGSFLLGYVRFDPRWTPLFWTWAPINLLLTCVSEEAFFRHFLQRELGLALAGRPYGAAVTIGTGTSAVLFGVAHAAGGWPYVALATLAGTGYALAFHRSGRIEMAILTHFVVNATHFLLFTYPALA
jgi:membrane protease YdiL (CAAX protease family)